jgi:hypothetical protein
MLQNKANIQYFTEYRIVSFIRTLPISRALYLFQMSIDWSPLYAHGSPQGPHTKTSILTTLIARQNDMVR